MKLGMKLAMLIGMGLDLTLPAQKNIKQPKLALTSSEKEKLYSLSGKEKKKFVKELMEKYIKE
jgi:hypothetical protein